VDRVLGVASAVPENIHVILRGGEKSGCFITPSRQVGNPFAWEGCMIRKLKSGEYRLYSRKKDAKSGKRKNLGTFKTRAGAEKHERAVQFFKRA
jgi:hypothetical protein